MRIQGHGREPVVYVCNCNGIRERDVRQAIDQGADRPSAVFRHCLSRPQCAKCVCDVRRMIDSYRALAKIAAE
jgi:bacterioferritin-associated ferredoxin